MASTFLIAQGPTLSSSSCSHVLLPFQTSSFIRPIQKAFLSFASPVSQRKFFPFSFVSFHIWSSHSTLTLPLHRIPSPFLSHKCLGFLLLSIRIRCPNHLCSFLSTISVTGTSIDIPQIWLFLILSLLVFLKHEGRSEMTASYCIMLVHNVRGGSWCQVISTNAHTGT